MKKTIIWIILTPCLFFGFLSTPENVYAQSRRPTVQYFIEKASTIPTLYNTLCSFPEEVRRYGFIKNSDKNFRNDSESIYAEDGLIIWLVTIDLYGRDATNFIQEISQNFNSRYGEAEVTNDLAKGMVVNQWFNDNEKIIHPKLLGWMVINFTKDRYVSVQCIFEE